MKNAIFIHGDRETPNSFWFPYLKSRLEKRGYKVWIPYITNFKKQVSSILREGEFKENTLLVGHSAGCQFILNILENLSTPVRKIVLISGYAYPLSNEEDATLGIVNYNWKKIKTSAREFIFINSVNDPWGCSDKHGRYMFDRLGGTLVINQEGHMGSTKFNQPYKEFPLLLQLIDEPEN